MGTTLVTTALSSLPAGKALLNPTRPPIHSVEYTKYISLPAQVLQYPPALDWTRASLCGADDVVSECFDAERSCKNCCDLDKGPEGNTTCWMGWMTYKTCCGRASRLWAGCGWRFGADLWAHEYFSLAPPKLHSPSICQQRCAEDPSCS
eukprot:1087585-Amphidinium_carterae.1